MAEHGREQVAQTTTQTAFSSHVRLNSRAKELLREFQDLADSPKAQLVLRNAIFTLLELSDEGVTRDEIGQFLRDDDYRAQIVRRLTEQTPEFWSEEWNASWRRDREPLLSEIQERIATRASLLEFWTGEWTTISEDVKTHVAKAFRQ